VFVCDDGAQAVTARSIVRGQLGVSGESVNRGPKGRADRFRHFRGNGNDANGQHELFLTLFSKFRELISLSTLAIVRQVGVLVLSDFGVQNRFSKISAGQLASKEK
jgi:hypothetical protein